jgi:hypothetical protein
MAGPVPAIHELRHKISGFRGYRHRPGMTNVMELYYLNTPEH